MLFSQTGFTNLRKKNRDGLMRFHPVWLKFQGFFKLQARHFIVALTHVHDTQLGIGLCGNLVIDSRVFLLVRGSAGGRKEHINDKQTGSYSHTWPTSTFSWLRTRRRVLSMNCPASCPQAASISSPRVRRVIVTIPARLRISKKRSMRASGLRL